MVRSGRSQPQNSPQNTVPPVVENNSNQLEERLQRPCSETPLRTLVFVEVGSLPVKDVQAAILQVSQMTDPKHPTWVVPTRNGKFTSDVVFEAEFLSTIRSLCEIKDGQIVFKEACKDVDVLRTRL